MVESRNSGALPLATTNWQKPSWLSSISSVLFNQRGYETPDDPKEIIPRHVDAILYGKEDDLDEDASAYEWAIRLW